LQAKAYVKAPKETDVMPRFRTVKRRDQEKGRGKIQNCQEERLPRARDVKWKPRQKKMSR